MTNDTTTRGECALHVFRLAERVTPETLPDYMRDVQRMAIEWQIMFIILLVRNKDTVRMAFGSKAVTDWVIANIDEFGSDLRVGMEQYDKDQEETDER